MYHSSIKAFVPSLPEMQARLTGTLGAYPLGEPGLETDYTYTLVGTNGQLKVKLRENDTALSGLDNNSLIVEKSNASETVRDTELAVIPQVTVDTLNELHNLFGPADHEIRKERHIFKTPMDPDLRIYLDRYCNSGKEYTLMEMQLNHARHDDEQAHKTLQQYMAMMQIKPEDMTNLSYSALSLKEKFKNNHILANAFHDIPDRLAQKIMDLGTYKAKRPHRLIEKNAQETHAFLILNGSAHTDNDQEIVAGKLVGEFSLFEGGVRTGNVTASGDFEALILPPRTLTQIMQVPAFMMKYNQWKLDQVNTRYGLGL